MHVPTRNVFLLLLATLFAVACSDSRTTTQPTNLDPGDRFPEVFPSQVTDLAVHAVNHRAVELSWTEVDDGKGQPAQYQVRLVPGSGDWTDGTVVRDGACAYPVRGSQVGARAHCIVSGLDASRTYTLLVGSERAALTGTVVGQPSARAAARTWDEPRVAIPTQVEIISGDAQIGTVGQALSTEVRLLLKDSLGAPMPNVYVLWASGEGGGRTAAPLSVSDASGVVHTVWTLGPQAGPQSLGIRIDGQDEIMVVADAVPGPVHQLRFMADTVTLGLDEEYTPEVRGWDEYGNVVDHMDLEWETSNRATVDVDARGVVRVNGRGWGWIRAWIRDHLRKKTTSDSTTVVVEADPSALSSVSIANSGQDWLNVKFTEVDDGTGSPADYATRLGSPGTGWNDAVEIVDGPCGTPMSGTAVGAARSCTVSGLDAGTTFVVFVRPFRMKNGERVYAPQASSATGTTLAPPQIPAGVAPESGVNQVGVVGSTLPNPIVVRVLDAAGAPVPGTQVSFSTTDGGSVSTASALTDASGRAQVSWTLGSKVGNQSLLTSIAGPSGAPGTGPMIAASMGDPVAISATANAGPAATLTLTPAALSLQLGESSSLSAKAVDVYGNATSTAGVVWSSDDSSIASVTSTGGVGAVAAGMTSIRARVGSAVAAAPVSIQGESSPTTPDPTQITDLRVVTTTDQSVTVEFTEVDDGTGSAAITEIRYAFSPMGWGWGSATVVGTGSCASPMAGGTVGAARRCVVEGLQSGTTYDFQMVAWRAEEGNNVFSSLSNVVTGTTELGSTPVPPTVASIEVTPKQVSFDQIGQSLELFAVAYDSSQQVLATPITWTSSNPTVATVSSGGIVTARALGTAVITAAAVCCGQSDASQITVASVQLPPPPPTTGSAWYEQRWNFTSTAQMLAAPDIGDATYPAGGSVSLLTGLSNTPGGFTTAMRATYFGNREKPQAGVDITLPRAAADKPREIWVEFFTRFSPNWTTLGPFSGGADHKFFFMFDQAPSSEWRWENMVGVFGSNIQVMVGGDSHGFGSTGGVSTLLWDSAWHRMRYHAKMDNTTGTFTLRIDDGPSIGFTGQDTNRGSQYYFQYVSLARNLNRGATADQWVDFGPVRVWTTNPGW